MSESEAVLDEEEVKVEDRWRLYVPFRWINRSFTCLKVCGEGAVVVAAAATALDAEDSKLANFAPENDGEAVDIARSN